MIPSDMWDKPLVGDWIYTFIPVEIIGGDDEALEDGDRDEDDPDEDNPADDEINWQG